MNGNIGEILTFLKQSPSRPKGEPDQGDAYAQKLHEEQAVKYGQQ